MDFKPLYQKYSLKDKELLRISRYAGSYTKLFQIGAVVFWGLPALSVLFSTMPMQARATNLVIFSVLTICSVLLVKYIAIYTARRILPLLMWARANDLVYVPNLAKIYTGDALSITNKSNNTADLPIPTESSLLGQSAASSSHVIGNRQFSVFEYSYQVGSGKNRHTVYWYVGSIRLARKLPHVLLDNRSGIFSGRSLPRLPDDSQKINTEASFSKHFSTYAPSGYAIDVLSFLAPDVMLQLTQNYTDYDIEIMDDMVLLYGNGQLQAKNIETLYGLLSSLRHALQDNIDTYKDSHLSAAADSSTESRTAISYTGQRLQRTGFGVTASVSAVIFTILIFILFLFISSR